MHIAWIQIWTQKSSFQVGSKSIKAPFFWQMTCPRVAWPATDLSSNKGQDEVTETPVEAIWAYTYKMDLHFKHFVGFEVSNPGMPCEPFDAEDQLSRLCWVGHEAELGQLLAEVYLVWVTSFWITKISLIIHWFSGKVKMCFSKLPQSSHGVFKWTSRSCWIPWIVL